MKTREKSEQILQVLLQKSHESAMDFCPRKLGIDEKVPGPTIYIRIYSCGDVPRERNTGGCAPNINNQQVKKYCPKNLNSFTLTPHHVLVKTREKSEQILKFCLKKSQIWIGILS